MKTARPTANLFSLQWKFLLPCLVFLLLLHSNARGASLERVRLQLKWYHQFQFAGYYAAQFKGFYRDEGLDVELVEGSRDRSPDRMVLEGKAEFGVMDGGDLIYHRLQGEPLVALAAIFQHSPLAIVSNKSRGFRHPSDLVGHSVMLTNARDSAQFIAMFRREGIGVQGFSDLAPVRFVPHSWNFDDLVEGRVDAMTAYLTDMSLALHYKGFEPVFMRPLEYGIDFYGDTLFTSAAIIKGKPDLVARFRRASLKGWQYAMANQGEACDRILALPTARRQRLERQMLVHEAAAMQEIVLPTLVEMGNMNPGRWERMAQVYREQGVVASTADLNGFIYEIDAEKQLIRKRLHILGLGLGGVSLLALLSLVWIRQLRSQVAARTREMERLSSLQRAILDNAAYAIITTTEDGIITSFNPAAEKLLGYTADELVGTQTPAIFHLPEEVDLRAGELAWTAGETPAGFEVFVAPSRAGEANESDWTYVRKDGARVAVRLEISAMRDQSGKIGGFLCFASDISEQRQLEDQLRQQQKLESIGLLAGGISHDFNNMLTPIFVYAEMIRKKFPEQDPVHKRAASILQAAGKAKDLVKQLLSFSRNQVLSTQRHDLNRIITEFSDILRRTIRESVVINHALCPEPCPIRADRTRIEQVLLNLAVNAQDAISGNGTISIETGHVTLDDEYCHLHPGARPGQYVLMNISDSGSGMANATLSHIFEPFFSTKAVGKGTGLGLSTVYGIVKQHNGSITVRSKPGSGSSFRIYLPVASTAEEQVARRPVSREVAMELGQATILLVEDNEMVMEMTRELLENNGCSVLSAYLPEDALDMALRHPERIDLLLTDVVMPQMNGQELHRRLREFIPELPVLYMSGYTGKVDVQQGTPEEASCIDKPFTADMLLAGVAKVLTRAGQREELQP